MAVSKSDFSAEEWHAIVGLPVDVSMVVSLASPPLGDMMKESMALAGKLAELTKDPATTGLLAEIGAEYKDTETLKKAKPELDKSNVETAVAKLLDNVRSSVALLDTKAGADAVPVKKWLYGVAVATAEAAKEGDFMGIGGVKVSESEKAALAQLAGILQVPA